MKRYMMTVTMLFLVLQMNAEYTKDHKLPAYKQCVLNNKKQPQKITFMDCLPSTVVSSIVGAFTGGLTRYLERELKIGESQEDLLFFMISWCLECKARHIVINSLEADFYESDIPHKRGLMRFFAWMSSWIAYLKV